MINLLKYGMSDNHSGFVVFALSFYMNNLYTRIISFLQLISDKTQVDMQ